jgi:hypothetical protein
MKVLLIAERHIVAVLGQSVELKRSARHFLFVENGAFAVVVLPMNYS